jgi:hypothetical protein
VILVGFQREKSQKYKYKDGEEYQYKLIMPEEVLITRTNPLRNIDFDICQCAGSDLYQELSNFSNLVIFSCITAII